MRLGIDVAFDQIVYKPAGAADRVVITFACVFNRLIQISSIYLKIHQYGEPTGSM